MCYANILKRNSRRERGSTLILAVVVVLLLAMLGAGFIQISRMDRRTMNQMDTTSDTYEGSIIRYIAAVLGSDVVDGNGDFFVDTIEGYDYPWTDPTTSVSIPDRFSPTVVPGRADTSARAPRDAADHADAAGLFEAFGFESGLNGDDPWLASTQPDFAAGTWPHITTLTGVALDLSVLVPDPVSGIGQYPSQYLTTADANVDSGDTNLLMTTMAANPGKFGDADGDGVFDSRWTWAPLPTKLGRSFVMCVRIVDNSAMANVNVWTPQGAPAGLAGKTAAEAPRFLWPGELNLDGPFQTDGTDAIADLILERNVDTSFSAANGRYWNWLDASRVYGDLNGATDLATWNPLNNETITARLGAFAAIKTNDGSEAELRWRNGLNRSSDNLTPDTDAPIETIQGGSPDWRNLEVASDWMGATGGYGVSYQSFVEDNPRPRMTTISGAAAYGQSDINAGATVLQPRIFEAMDGGLPYTKIAYWVDNSTFSDQMAATIVDWRDADSLLTRQGNTYGLEYLPFITGVYIQGDYTAAIDLPAAGDVTWNETGNKTILIELVNPWPWEVTLPDVELGVDGALWGSLQTMTSKTTLTAHELFTVRVDVGTGSGGVDYSPLGHIDITGSGTVAWPVTAANDPIQVELYAPVAGDPTNPVLYQIVPTQNAGSQIIEFGRKTATPAISNGDPGYYQPVSIGSGDGLAVLTVSPTELQPLINTVDTTGTVTHLAAADPLPAMLFGVHAKGRGFDISDNRISDSTAAAGVGYVPNSGDEPLLIGNRGRIYRTGDLLRMVVLGPRDGLTIGEVWQNAQTAATAAALGTIGIGDFILDTADTAQDENNVNHAVAMLSRFTSLHPGGDGQDNDGDSKTDEDDELFIPASININTATRAMIENAIPIPNAAARTAIANRILAGRVDPALLDPSNTVSSRTTASGLGISHLGELLADLYTNDPQTNLGLTDFNEYETFPTTIAPGDADGYTDDAEAFATGISYLNQVASVRSDIYTAYILVRAYPSDDFSNGGLGTPLDEYRIVAVFDRSGLTDEQRSARVVALAVYKN